MEEKVIMTGNGKSRRGEKSLTWSLTEWENPRAGLEEEISHVEKKNI